MRNTYEDELEVLMLNNPRGGKPQKIGATLWTGLQPAKSLIEVSDVQENTTMRFHLGYCHCGNKLVMGEKRALVVIKKILGNLSIDSVEDLDTRILTEVMKKPHF